MSSTAVPPRKKTTSIDAVTVGTDEVNAGFSSGAKSSATHPGSETYPSPSGRMKSGPHYQTRECRRRTQKLSEHMPT